MAALSSLEFKFRPARDFTSKAAKTGSAYNDITLKASLTAPVVELGTAIANASVGGSDQMISKIYTATASGTASIDLTTFTDVLERSAGSFARIKYIEFWLLSTTDDTTNGTACSSVSIGNAASNANVLYMGGATETTKLYNGDIICYASRKAAGLTVDSTHKAILVTNNDGAVAMALQVTIVGGST